MAIIGWIVSVMTLLGGLALWQQPLFAHADRVAMMLFGMALLSFPPFWTDAPLGLSRKPRIAACLALLLSLPLVLLRP
ncbi:hypothetical protein [Sphingobium aquiterrae]|uniref:hypothetical protein n=1 Tax=Sphingobium aquiterrae TaxID=2038656 RepID=UPI0030163EDF